MSAIPVSNKQLPLSVEEYFKLDEESEIRYEFNEGFLKPIDGASARHNKIVRRTANMVESAFDAHNCSVYSESVKLEIVKGKHYAFPDIMLTCHGFDQYADYLMHFPSLIIEVLSPTTADYDHGKKFKLYRNIPTLEYYLLIEQKHCWVELFSRAEDPKEWAFKTYDEMENIISFPKLNFTMALSDIYKDITFDPPETWDL